MLRYLFVSAFVCLIASAASSQTPAVAQQKVCAAGARAVGCSCAVVGTDGSQSICTSPTAPTGGGGGSTLPKNCQIVDGNTISTDANGNGSCGPFPTVWVTQTPGSACHHGDFFSVTVNQQWLFICKQADATHP